MENDAFPERNFKEKQNELNGLGGFGPGLEHAPAKSLSEEEVAAVQSELAETKSKLRIITQKFANAKKESSALKQENKEMQNEIISLQTNIRQMVPGFANSGSSFPLFNELQNQVSEFYKCDCQDAFFDLLVPELNMDGIVYFFTHTFRPVIDVVEQYFSPLHRAIMGTVLLESVEGPIINVLRKSYQNNWKSIYGKCFPPYVAQKIMSAVQGTLKLGDEAPAMNTQVAAFVQKMSEVCFAMHISDPVLSFDLKALGEKVQYNPVKHDSVDGFIKNKEECLIILPPVYKGPVSSGEVILKANVLPLNYEFP